MVQATPSESLRSLVQLIRDDWNGKYRKYPDQTSFALQDHRVLSAIEKRFGESMRLRDIRLLQYDFYTGLHNLVFDFAAESPAPLPGAASSILVILDGKGAVIGFVDPFDPVQPNRYVPPLPKEGDQPFVLDRPSASSEVSLSAQDMFPVQVRSQSFFQRLQGGGGVVISPIPIDINSWTSCNYQTWTPYGTVLDIVIDDCGQPWLHEA